jgi:hypothetical protein
MEGCREQVTSSVPPCTTPCKLSCSRKISICILQCSSHHMICNPFPGYHEGLVQALPQNHGGLYAPTMEIRASFPPQSPHHSYTSGRNIPRILLPRWLLWNFFPPLSHKRSYQSTSVQHIPSRDCHDPGHSLSCLISPADGVTAHLLGLSANLRLCWRRPCENCPSKARRNRAEWAIMNLIPSTAFRKNKLSEVTLWLLY